LLKATWACACNTQSSLWWDWNPFVRKLIKVGSLGENAKNKKKSPINDFKTNTSQWTGFELTALVVIGTDRIGSCDHDHDSAFFARKLWWTPHNINEQKMKNETFNLWNSNPVHCEVYSIQHYVKRLSVTWFENIPRKLECKMLL
jgi:hypothetical protein